MHLWKRWKWNIRRLCGKWYGRIVSLVHIITSWSIHPQYDKWKKWIFCGLATVRKHQARCGKGQCWHRIFRRTSGTILVWQKSYHKGVWLCPEFQRQGYGSLSWSSEQSGSGQYHDEIILDTSLPAIQILRKYVDKKTLRHERIDVGGGVMLVYEVMKKSARKIGDSRRN